jgi:energy-converting hydrogenase Eha subunit C
LNGDIVRRFLDTIFLWILPGIHSHWIEAGVLIGFCVAFAWLAWRNSRQPDNLGRTNSMFIGVLLTFLISYTAILGASLSFFDASTPIDNRILSPLLVAGMMILLLACGYASQRAWLSALAGFALLLVVIIFMSSALHRSRDLLSNIRASGAGFTGRAWKTSPLIVWMKTLEGEPTIVTNQAMAVQFTTQRLSIQIPENLDPVTAQVRSQYQDELARTRALLKKPDSYLVLFGAAGSFPEPDPGLIAGLEPLLSEADGRVYVDPASRIR